MLLIPGLPRPTPQRLRFAALLTAGLVSLQLLRTTTGFFNFAAEADGLGERLDQAAPGQSLAGLIYEPGGELGANGWKSRRC